MNLCLKGIQLFLPSYCSCSVKVRRAVFLLLLPHILNQNLSQNLQILSKMSFHADVSLNVQLVSFVVFSSSFLTRVLNLGSSLNLPLMTKAMVINAYFFLNSCVWIWQIHIYLSCGLSYVFLSFEKHMGYFQLNWFPLYCQLFLKAGTCFCVFCFHNMTRSCVLWPNYFLKVSTCFYDHSLRKVCLIV